MSSQERALSFTVWEIVQLSATSCLISGIYATVYYLNLRVAISFLKNDFL